MQPHVIRLSDALRQTLAQALATVEPCSDESLKINRATLLLAEMLSSTAHNGIVAPLQSIDLPDAAQTFLVGFHEEYPRGSALHNELCALNDALLGLNTGASHPLLYMENLPCQGKLLFAGFMRLQNKDVTVDSGTVHIPSLRFTRGLHQEVPECSETKYIFGFYCASPGDSPVPTVFISGEDIVSAMAADVTMRRRYGDEKAIANRLQRLQVHGENMPIAPLLTRNPQLADNPDAPKYILHLPDSTLPNSPSLVADGVPNAKELLRDVQKAVESLRAKLTEEGIVNMKPNTMGFWNDRFMLHDRGGEPSTDKTDSDRVVYSSLAKPDYARAEGQGESVLGVAIGAPCANIHIPAIQKGKQQLSTEIVALS